MVVRRGLDDGFASGGASCAGRVSRCSDPSAIHAEHLCFFMDRSLSIVLGLPYASFLGALGPIHRMARLQVLQVPNLLQWPLLNNTATQLSKMMQSPLAIKPNSRTRSICEPPRSPPLTRSSPHSHAPHQPQPTPPSSPSPHSSPHSPA